MSQQSAAQLSCVVVRKLNGHSGSLFLRRRRSDPTRFFKSKDRVRFDQKRLKNGADPRAGSEDVLGWTLLVALLYLKNELGATKKTTSGSSVCL